MNSGLYYYKLISEYQDDVTKECKLTINEIDHNFKTLKDNDVKEVEFIRGEDIENKSDGTLVVTKNDGEKIIVPIDVTLNKNLTYDLNVGVEECQGEGATLTITYKDDEGEHEVVLENVITKNNLVDVLGSDILTKVITDSSLRGLGTMRSPLGLSRVEKTGMLAPAEEVLDLTDGSELPSVAKYGTRVVTKEYVNDYGYLYNGAGVEKISNILDTIYEENEINKEVKSREYYWHVPSKAEWDALLNSVEPCEYQNHNSAQCHIELGKLAGKYFKSDCGWVNSEYECTCNGNAPITACSAPTSATTDNGIDVFDEDDINPNENEISPVGVDKFGMRVLPSGTAKFVRDVPRVEGFKESASFWTTTHIYDDVNQDIYIKVFDYDKSGVYQVAECPQPYYSVRLVKKYDGSNYKSSEYIDGILYEAILFPESGQIWLASNFADKKGFITYHNREEGQIPELLEVNNGEIPFEKRTEMFINEFNGYSWEKKVMVDGDTIVIQNPCLSPSGTTTVCWLDDEGGEHCIEVEIPEVAQSNIEFRVYTEDDECNKSLVNTDNLVVERVVNIVVPMIEKERFERIEADAVLSGAIDAVSAAVETVSGAVESETERAISAETALSGAIESEIERAISAETALSGAIEDEAARAISAETALSGAIETEIERAISAETALDEKIDAEIERAISAETALDEKIDAEIERAISAETVLDNQLIDVTQDYVISADVSEDNEEYNLVFKSKDGEDEHSIKVKFDGNFGEI